MVLRQSRIHPIVSRQYILIEPSVHPLAGTPGGEGASSAHEGVEDGEGVEVAVEVGGALKSQHDVCEVRERVGPHHWWPLPLLLKVHKEVTKIRH